MDESKKILNWLLIGGATLFVWPLFILFDVHRLSSAPLLLILFSFPHFFLSYAAYYSQSGLARSKPVVSFYAPAALAIGLAVASQSPLARTWVCELALYLLLFHISMQAYGVALFSSPKLPKTYLIWKRSILVNALAWSWVAWVYQQNVGMRFPAFKSYLDPIALPDWALTVALAIALISSLFCVTIWTTFLRRLATVEQTVMTWTPLLTLTVWCIPAFGLVGLGLVAVMHGLQYLPFVWMKFERNRWSLKTSLAVTASMIVAAYLCFEYLPRALSATYSVQAGALVTALYVFLNVHHFVIERVLWTRRHFYEQGAAAVPAASDQCRAA